MDNSSIIEELEEMYLELGRLSTIDVDKLNKPRRIEWTGLIGVAQDYLKEREVNNFLESSLLDTNFLNVPGFLIKKANALTSVFDNDNKSESNISIAERVVQLIEDSYSLWLSKCPGIDNAIIDDEIGKGVSLPLGIVAKYHLYHSFQNYPLSESTKERVDEQVNFLEWRVNKLIEKEKSNSSSSSGCLGILIIFIITSWILVSCNLL